MRKRGTSDALWNGDQALPLLGRKNGSMSPHSARHVDKLQSIASSMTKGAMQMFSILSDAQAADLFRFSSTDTSSSLMPNTSFHAGIPSVRVSVIALGVTFSVLLAGCANRNSSPPVAEISQPQVVKVAYHAPTCSRLAPQLVSLARQEHELSSQSKRSASASALVDTRQQKESLRAEMRANGCF